MPTTFDYKMLADGQVPASKTALFTATAETAIKSISFCNTNASANTVTVWINHTGTDRQIASPTLQQNEILLIEDVLLENGGILKAQATNGSQVDYVIEGGVAT